MDVELATRYGQANQGSMDVAGRFGRKSNWMFVIIGASLLMITLMRFKPLCPDEVFAAGYGADSFPDRALLRTVDNEVCTTLLTSQAEKSKNGNVMADCTTLVPKILTPQCCAFAIAADADQSEQLDVAELKTLTTQVVRYKKLITLYYQCSGFGSRACPHSDDVATEVRNLFHDLDKNHDNWLEQRELVGIFAAFGSAVSSPQGGMSERSFSRTMLHLTRSYPFLLDRDHNGVLDEKEMKLVHYFFTPSGIVGNEMDTRCPNFVLWVSRVQTLRRLVELDTICPKGKTTFPLDVLRRLGVVGCFDQECGHQVAPVAAAAASVANDNGDQ